MVDPVGSLKQIAKVALKIKEAVETVRQNKEECLEIGKHVTIVSDILSQLENTEMMNNLAMSAALKVLDETLRRAHTLVTACQEKNSMCLFCTATKLSKQLRRVKDDISVHLMVGIFATTVTVILTPRIHDDDAHPPPPKGCRPGVLATTAPEAIEENKAGSAPTIPQCECECFFQNAEDPAGPKPLSGLLSRNGVVLDTLSVAEFGGRAAPAEGFEIPFSAAAYEGYEMAEHVAAPAVKCSAASAVSTAASEGYEMAGEENNVPTGSEMSSPPSSSLRELDGVSGSEMAWVSEYEMDGVSGSEMAWVSEFVMAGEENNVPTGSEMSSPPSSRLIVFSLTELEVATQHFSTIVGQGGFATVYKVTPYASFAYSVLEASLIRSFQMVKIVVLD